jgi:hypothetical protein
VNKKRLDTRLVTVAVAVIAMISAALLMWSRLTTPTDLTDIDPILAQWSSNGVVVTMRDGAVGELRSGDRVVAVEGRSLRDWADHVFDQDVNRPSLTEGSTLIYQVERDGQLLNVRVVLQPYSLHSTVARNWSLVLLTLLLVALGIYVFVRRPHDPAAQAVLRYSCLTGWAAAWVLIDLEIIDLVTVTGLWRYVVGEFAAGLWLGGLLHFFLVFPRRQRVLAERPWLVGLVYVGPLIVHGVWLAGALPTVSTTLERLRYSACP